MILGAVERIGLTQLGIQLWFEMRAIFTEHLVEVGWRGGEPVFAGSPRSGEQINAGWEKLWQEMVGIRNDPVYIEILGELTDRPRGRTETVQRIVKKAPSISPKKVASAIDELLRAEVLTTDEKQIYVG